MNTVCILGSINMDIILNVSRMPQIGETITGNSLKNAGGGKGANQAVAAKRSGAKVYMIGKVGRDSSGSVLVDSLKHDEINTEYIFESFNTSTGTALITVDESGNNSIIVVPGANKDLTAIEIEASRKAIEASDILITQFETPIDRSTEAFKIAKNKGNITILNPAPAKSIPDELLLYTDIIVPNETEAFELTGIRINNLKDAEKAANVFLEKGVKYVIITLGEKGAALIGSERSEIIPSFKVHAVDTTAAGDSFIGGLASVLDVNNMGFDALKKAVIFGSKVSSIAVQRVGAQPSIPYLKEVIETYGED